MAGLVKDEIYAWGGFCKKRDFVKIIIFTSFWVLWKERNSRTFESNEVKI